MQNTPPLAYEPAPFGSPDRFRLTADTHFTWHACPARFWDLAQRRCLMLDDGGYCVAFASGDRKLELQVRVPAGFFFAVSVAPNFKRALPAALLHDYLYSHADELASAWGCPRREVLRLADHWFLALMRFSGFFFKRTYFIYVRIFGYAFNTLFGARHDRA